VIKKVAWSVVLTIVFCGALLVAVAHARASDTTPEAVRIKRAVELLDGYRGITSELEEARAELEAVLDANPRSAVAYRELTRYIIKRGHINSDRFEPGTLEAANAALDKAIELDPKYAEAFVLRGHLYRLMHRHQDALDALAKAERLGTTDPWLQNNWADLLIEEGRYEAAAERYRKVIDSGTPNRTAMASAYDGLIQYYLRTSMLEKADEVYRKQIDFEPETAWIYGDYAWFLLCFKDDYEGAITRSRQALDRMDYGVGRHWLASSLYRKWAQGVIDGHPDAGKEAFLEAKAMYADPYEIVAAGSSCPAMQVVAQALARENGQAAATQQ
jgi:Tfp pilus assembly protein PilF